MRASAVPLPGRRHRQPGGEGIESQAPRSCDGSVIIPASALRTISSHHLIYSGSIRTTGSAPVPAASPGTAPGRNGRSHPGALCRFAGPCLCRERAGTPTLFAAGAEDEARAAPRAEAQTGMG